MLRRTAMQILASIPFLGYGPKVEPKDNGAYTHAAQTIALCFCDMLVEKMKIQGINPETYSETLTFHLFDDPTLFKQKRIGWYGWVQSGPPEAGMLGHYTDIAAAAIDLKLEFARHHLEVITDVPILINKFMNDWIQGKIIL
jgi:hypothetical protein